MVQTTNQLGSESYSGKKIPRSKIRTGSIPVAGTKKDDPKGSSFLVLPNRTDGESPGSDLTAASGGLLGVPAKPALWGEEKPRHR